MRNPIKNVLTMLMALFCCLTVSAHDFAVKNDDGVTIYYSITSKTDLTCAVSFRGFYHDDYYNEYSGVVNIPSSVVYKNQTYSVTSIGKDAFDGCKGLTSVSIPESVTKIGDNAFYGCSDLTSLTIPVSVTSIGYKAFYCCVGLNTLTIPESVTSIGGEAFSGCKALESVVFNATNYTAYKMGSSEYPVFKGCSSLTNVTIGNNVEIIPDYAFYGCIGLTSVTIPMSVTFIGVEAFHGCIALESVVFNAKNCTYMGSGSSHVFEGCSSLMNVTIGDNVENIPSYAFYGCRGLTSVTIPESVTSIGYDAFADCRGLTFVTIPESVVSIKSSAFSGCSGLPVENNLRYADTFLVGAVDKSLSSFNIKEGTKWIGQNAFSGCSDLTSLTIPVSVTSIGGYAFSGCSSLTSITIPKSVTSIEGSAFRSCCSLTTVTISEGVTTIGEYAFSGCSSLESFSFGASVEYISMDAFSDCTNLTKLYAEPSTPPTCYPRALNDINKWNCTLFVAADAVEKYKTAAQWKDFFFIEAYDFSNGIEVVNSEPGFTGVYRVFNLKGAIVLTTKDTNDIKALEKGVYIVNGKKIMVK